MGKLTTHVLDIFNGHPAINMRIELWQISPERKHILTVITNDDGRCDKPLLSGDAMIAGEYELIFNVRGYFEALDVESPFLNQVPIRFSIFDATAHYHVPLSMSPWAYNTYRGS